MENSVGYPLPKEAASNFTVQEWESFDVKVVRVERDETGNLIEIDEGISE